MKLNDVIKKILTTFSKEVAKDVSKLQKDIVNLKPKSGANPPTSGDYIGQIFAKEDGPTKKLKFWDGTNWTNVSESQSASEIEGIVDTAVSKKFKTGTYDDIPKNGREENVAKGYSVGSIYIDYDSNDVYCLDRFWKWNNIKKIQVNDQLPQYESYAGELYYSPRIGKLYICLGGTNWVELYNKNAQQVDTSKFITRDELNTTLKKIEEEISKIRGK